MRRVRVLLRLITWPVLLVRANLLVWVIAPLAWLVCEKLTTEIEAGASFEVSAPLRTTVLTHWRAPFTGGFRCTIPVGVRLRVHTGAPAGSRRCAFVPYEPSEFEQRFVPSEDSSADGFAGVSVPLTARQIRRHLRRLPAV